MLHLRIVLLLNLDENGSTNYDRLLSIRELWLFPATPRSILQFLIFVIAAR